MTKASFELYCYLLILPLQVEVPFEFHRFIIGRGGENVRKLMNKHDVNIKVPSSDKQSSVIVVTGPKAYVESARQGLYIETRCIIMPVYCFEIRQTIVLIQSNMMFFPLIT